MKNENEDQKMLTAPDSVETSVSPSADDVKQYSSQQREALPGEPQCIQCGRYGEYICNETDDDICSLECKQNLLHKIKEPKIPTTLPLPSIRLPANDECFYVTDGNKNSKSESQSLTTKQIESIRLKFQINVKTSTFIPPPMLSFSRCNLPQKLLQNIESAGYEIPTPVQMQAIPAALKGQSLLVSSETGSGKTASYLIPAISFCSNFRKEPKNPLVIVLTPTRELSIQVEQQAKILAKGLPFKTALVVGGDAMPRQIHRIQTGIEMIIGTPGRLIDLLTKHDVHLDMVSILVIDEVDCMLQKGFREQVMQIYISLSQPQVLLYSATIPSEVTKMATSLAKEKTINIITIGKSNKPNEKVKQVVIWVESKQKKKKLFEIFSSKVHYKPPVIVFVGSRVGADMLSEAISVTMGMKAMAIHGEKSMKERREVLRLLMVGEIEVVVATGILGRGIDVVNVGMVIVFDMPNSVEEYVHMIGRGSRMGEEGRSIVFVNEEDRKLFPELVGVLRESGAVIPREIGGLRYLGDGNREKRKRKVSW
ncbi:hypothetical protein LXL04_012968 [Taraxacum kok-saghyz]